MPRRRRCECECGVGAAAAGVDGNERLELGQLLWLQFQLKPEPELKPTKLADSEQTPLWHWECDLHITRRVCFE